MKNLATSVKEFIIDIEEMVNRIKSGHATPDDLKNIFSKIGDALSSIGDELAGNEISNAFMIDFSKFNETAIPPASSLNEFAVELPSDCTSKT